MSRIFRRQSTFWFEPYMKKVAITQRVSIVPGYGERRDCLDQGWTTFLAACGLLPVLLPNVVEVAVALCGEIDIAGFVLTGGNDLAELGGDAPERDAVENALLDLGEKRKLPLLGVCRGMQVIQRRFEIEICPVEGHVAKKQIIRIDGQPKEVNSYHRFGAFGSKPPLDVWAIADDGVVKAIRHSRQSITGIMWHPERFSPFSAADVELFRGVFEVK